MKKFPNFLKIFHKKIGRFQISTQEKYYDIVISGGGPAGIATACALSKSIYFQDQEAQILLIDQDKPVSMKNYQYNELEAQTADQRMVTLTPASIRYLKSIGIWFKLNHSRVTPFHHMQVWEEGGSSYLRIDSKDGNYMGFTCENRHLVAAGLETIKNQKNIELISENSIEKIQFKENSLVELQLKNSDCLIKTRLVIGSDGLRSQLKKQSNIPTYGWSQHQMGIACTVKCEQKFSLNTAFQRFMNDGSIIALLPLWGDFYSIVWSVSVEDYEQLMKIDEKKFILELNYALSRPSQNEYINLSGDKHNFQFVPYITELCNKRLSFPLNTLQSQRYIKDRVALIGDAAHSIHPLGGQGLNMGLSDSALLANLIIKHKRVGHDFGKDTYLEEYELGLDYIKHLESKKNNYVMTGGMEFVKWAYSLQYQPLQIARNVAINVINYVPIIKNNLQQVAEGSQFHPEKYEWE